MANAQFLVLTPPSTEPITLSDFKDYANIDFPDKDAMIGRLISRARATCEAVTGRAFATQTIRQVFTIERPTGGELSGPIKQGVNWYAFNEQLGANPFGPAQWYFELAMPPIQSTIQTITVETKVTAFQNWTAFPLIQEPGGTYNLYIETADEPARIFFVSPVTANFYRFTYTAGYSSSYPLPFDLQQCLYDLVSFWFDNREGEPVPDGIMNRLLARRVSWI